MNILDQSVIISRMKTDADLIAKEYEVDITDVLVQKLKNIKIEQLDKTTDSAHSSQYSLRSFILPLAGVAVLTLVFINFKELTSNIIQDNNLPQVHATQVAMNQQNVNSISANDVMIESKALEQDILYMTQVFSL